MGNLINSGHLAWLNLPVSFMIWWRYNLTPQDQLKIIAMVFILIAIFIVYAAQTDPVTQNNWLGAGIVLLVAFVSYTIYLNILAYTRKSLTQMAKEKASAAIQKVRNVPVQVQEYTRSKTVNVLNGSILGQIFR